MGSSIYQMGYESAWQTEGGYDPYGSSMIELGSLSQALNEVRERALHRLAEEARHVGADAVVGVETRAGESEPSGGRGQLALEHVVLGTAVRREGARGDTPSSTGDDRAVGRRLRAAPARGYRAGSGSSRWSSVFFSSYAYRGMLGAGGRDDDRCSSTSCANSPRRCTTRASGRWSQINRQAAALGAAGVVGVRIGHTIRPRSLNSGMGSRLRRARAARDDGHVQRRRHRDPPARARRDPSPRTRRRPVRLRSNSSSPVTRPIPKSEQDHPTRSRT